MPVLFFLIAFAITYVACFKDEFDQENIKSVWVLLGGFAALVLLIAILTSMGGSPSSILRS